MSRLCPQCGRPFEPTNGKQWWCDRECYNAAYHAANRGAFIKQQAACHAAKRERIAQRKAARATKLNQRAERRIVKRQAFLAKWSKLDWSKQNCELADEMGLSPERIRQIRQQIGSPQPNHPGRPRSTREALQWAKDNLDKIKGLSAAEVARKYGLTRHWRQVTPYQFLKPFLRDGRHIRKHRWDLMNFSLPNRDLERIWRLPSNMVGAYRHRKRRPPSPWRFEPGTGDIQCSRRGQLQAYARAVKAEERKAARYFAQA